MQLTQVELIKEAKKMGIAVDLLENCGTDKILLSKDNQEILFCVCGTPLTKLSYQAFFIANNKQYSKRLFQQLEISHPKSIVFNDVDLELEKIQAFWEKEQVYVCKPLNGSEGIGVCMNIESIEALKAAWNTWKNEYNSFMLEEQKDGGDLRIQVVGGQIVAACIREPAFVLGDGQSTLDQLVKKRQAEIQAQNPVNKLELDKASFELLEKQDLSLEDIPQKDQKVTLKYVANMSQGAISTDITEEMHPEYKKWIHRISENLNLSIYALDVLAKDYTAPPTAENAWAIEINGQPYWYHHTFSERRTHNIAKMILEDVFGP